MSAFPIEEREGAILFDILVAPRASRSKVGPLVGERLRVAVSAPPVEGKANAAVIEVLAEALGVKRHEVTIASGERGKRKRVRVAGIGPEVLRRLIEPT